MTLVFGILFLALGILTILFGDRIVVDRPGPLLRAISWKYPPKLMKWLIGIGFLIGGVLTLLQVID